MPVGMLCQKKENLHCRIVLFPNSNIIHIVGYGVQAGPNNGQQSNGTKSFKEEVMVHEHTVPHTHTSAEGRSFNSDVFCVAGYGTGGYGRHPTKGNGTNFVFMYSVVLENVQCVSPSKEAKLKFQTWFREDLMNLITS